MQNRWPAGHVEVCHCCKVYLHHRDLIRHSSAFPQCWVPITYETLVHQASVPLVLKFGILALDREMLIPHKKAPLNNSTSSFTTFQNELQAKALWEYTWRKPKCEILRPKASDRKIADLKPGMATANHLLQKNLWIFRLFAQALRQYNSQEFRFLSSKSPTNHCCMRSQCSWSVYVVSLGPTPMSAHERMITTIDILHTFQIKVLCPRLNNDNTLAWVTEQRMHDTKESYTVSSSAWSGSFLCNVAMDTPHVLYCSLFCSKFNHEGQWSYYINCHFYLPQEPEPGWETQPAAGEVAPCFWFQRIQCFWGHLPVWQSAPSTSTNIPWTQCPKISQKAIAHNPTLQLAARWIDIIPLKSPHPLVNHSPPFLSRRTVHLLDRPPSHLTDPDWANPSLDPQSWWPVQPHFSHQYRPCMACGWSGNAPGALLLWNVKQWIWWLTIWNGKAWGTKAHFGNCYSSSTLLPSDNPPLAFVLLHPFLLSTTLIISKLLHTHYGIMMTFKPLKNLQIGINENQYWG